MKVKVFSSVVGALGLLFLSASAPAYSADSETYRQLNLFGDVFERVRSDYVDEVSDTKLIRSAIRGMLADLDPHSSYMSPEDFKNMQVQTRGEFGGLGIEVTMENGVDQGGVADRRHAGGEGRHSGRRLYHPP